MKCLSAEPLAKGLGYAVFLNRNKFIGWVGKEPVPDWETGEGGGFWAYEVHGTYQLSKRFHDQDSAVEALYESWSGDWRRHYRQSLFDND